MFPSAARRALTILLASLVLVAALPAFSDDGATYGPAVPVEHDEVGEARGDGETYGAVMPAPGTRFVRVATDRPIARLTVLALDSTGRDGATSGSGRASAAIDQPGVVYPVQKLIFHHTRTRSAREPARTP